MYNSDFQDILLMQEQPEVIRNPSENSSNYENISPSQPLESIEHHPQQNGQDSKLLSTFLGQTIQEDRKKQNIKQNQNIVEELLISENNTQNNLQITKINSHSEQEAEQFENTVSRKVYLNVKEEIKEPLPQVSDVSVEKEKKSAKKADFLIPCQRENKTLFKSKQPKKQKKAIKEVSPPLQQQQTQDKQFLSRSIQKFQEFFRECKYQSCQFACSGGHRAEHVCFSKQCTQNAYICDQRNCQFRKSHESCTLKLSIDMFTEELNKNLERQREIALQLFLFEEKMIQQINDNRRKLKKLLPFQGIHNEELIQCLESKSQKDLELKGSQILTLLDQFHKQKKYDLHRLQSLRKNLAQEKKVVKDILQHPLRMVLKKFNLEELITMPSKLILNKPDVKYVLEQLNYPRELKLLYRASQNEFNLSKYHKICDNQQHTLTIIKTEHQKLIGGYTPIKLKTKMGRDKSNKTFLMAINLQEKLEHIHSGQCAIYYDKQLGPCFGGLYQQRDIQVYQQKGVLFCRTNFPNAYNWKRYFLSSQESWRFLTGVTEGKVCRVTDFEVFKVQFRE